MALKRNLNEDERFGLTEEEIKLAEKYLRKNKTAGALPEMEAIKLYELFMIGYSFNDIHQQYPHYPTSQIVLTAALRGWCRDRDKMMGSLRDRIQAKIVRSVIEQVDFLTTMLSVTNAEHIESMRKFIIDPVKNPKPTIRVESIKEYKEVADTLGKLVAGVGGADPKKKSPMMGALDAPRGEKPDDGPEEPQDPARLIAAQVIEPNE